MVISKKIRPKSKQMHHLTALCTRQNEAIQKVFFQQIMLKLKINTATIKNAGM